MERGRTTWVIVVLLVTGADVFADLMPVSGLDATDRPGASLVVASTPAPARSPCPAAVGVDSLYFNAGLMRFLPPASVDTPSSTVSQSPPGLAGGQGSLGLCLYALMGLGLCQSVPLVKKLRFAWVPDWYHSGGPYQIGHSLVIGPDCRLFPARVCCFVRTDDTVERLRLQYYRGNTASLLRKPQFTPTTLISRGPPSLS